VAGTTAPRILAGNNGNLQRQEIYIPNGEAFAELIERELREGYWRHLEACFDYKHSRVVELGYNIPYVERGDGFTYILYAPEMSRCNLLVGNASD
jgi:hypothetical protein